MKKYSICSYIILVLIGCTPERIEMLNGYDEAYFPLETGRYVIYQVDHTLYNVNGQMHDSYLLKESVVDSFLSPSQSYIYTLHRQRWNDISEKWELTQSWAARLENDEAILTEGSTQYLKLKLPVIQDKAWDGNAYNTNEEHIYQADSIGFAYQSDVGEEIANTITIVQSNILDKIVETDFRIEKYAPNIGLVYKEITNLEYCTTDECLGQQVIEQGQIYKQSIVTFGNE